LGPATHEGSLTSNPVNVLGQRTSSRTGDVHDKLLPGLVLPARSVRLTGDGRVADGDLVRRRRGTRDRRVVAGIAVHSGHRVAGDRRAAGAGAFTVTGCTGTVSTGVVESMFTVAVPRPPLLPALSVAVHHTAWLPVVDRETVQVGDSSRSDR